MISASLPKTYALGNLSWVLDMALVLAWGIDIPDQKIAEEELAKYRKLLESQVDERSNQLREARFALRQQQQQA